MRHVASHVTWSRKTASKVFRLVSSGPGSSNSKSCPDRAQVPQSATPLYDSAGLTTCQFLFQGAVTPFRFCIFLLPFYLHSINCSQAGGFFNNLFPFYYLSFDHLPQGVFALTIALHIRALPAARGTILNECRLQSQSDQAIRLRRQMQQWCRVYVPNYNAMR